MQLGLHRQPSRNTDSNFRYFSRREAKAVNILHNGNLTMCSNSRRCPAMVLGLYLRVSLGHAYTPRQSSHPVNMTNALPLHFWPENAKSFAKIRNYFRVSPRSDRVRSPGRTSSQGNVRLQAGGSDPQLTGGSHLASPMSLLHHALFRLRALSALPRGSSRFAPESWSSSARVRRRGEDPKRHAGGSLATMRARLSCKIEQQTLRMLIAQHMAQVNTRAWLSRHGTAKVVRERGR